jgi:uncharacterized protein YijF (DUF1287 family)
MKTLRWIKLFFLVAAFACLKQAEAQEASQLKLAQEARKLTNDQVTYDPQYFKIAYPNGDVPADKGVCTDVIIRAYRKMGIDLQRLVHEDMKRFYEAYPTGAHPMGVLSSMIASMSTFYPESQNPEI